MKKLIAALLGVLLAVALGFSFTITSGAARTFGSATSLRPDQHGIAVQELAERSPLYARLYLAKGLEEEKAGRFSAAQDLVAHAARIDPRLAEARLWLARRQLTDGRLAEAIDQLATLNAISDGLGPQVSALLSIAARQPEGRQVIAGRLSNQPLLLDVLRLSAARGATPRELLQLLSKTDLSSLSRGAETAQQLVIAGDLQGRQFTAAYNNWNALLPKGARVNAVYDGDFGGLPGSPPFSWTFKNDGSVGISSIKADLPGHATGLEIVSTGSLRTTVAEQLLVLAPGQYQLRAMVRSPRPPDQATGYDWTIACKDGPVITEASISGSADRWAPRSWTIEVPAGCPAQTLQLVSTASDLADQRTLQLTGVVAQRSR